MQALKNVGMGMLCLAILVVAGLFQPLGIIVLLCFLLCAIFWLTRKAFRVTRKMLALYPRLLEAAASAHAAFGLGGASPLAREIHYVFGITVEALRGRGMAILAGLAMIVGLTVLIVGLPAPWGWVSIPVVNGIAFLLSLFIFLPCAIFRVTRKFAAFGLCGALYVFGITVWSFGNYREAVEWYRLAMAQGYALAQESFEQLANQAPPAPTSNSATPMQRQGGTFVVPVIINNAITLNFVVDSGAADVSIPADVVSTLMRTGTLKAADFYGKRTYVLADGSEIPSQTFRIRSLKVGDKVVENVNGSMASAKGDLLLGQSFLRHFKSWSVDNNRNVLVLE
jgi:predicted aspartyl protease